MQYSIMFFSEQMWVCLQKTIEGAALGPQKVWEKELQKNSLMTHPNLSLDD